jgi:hypothetical protein
VLGDRRNVDHLTNRFRQEYRKADEADRGLDQEACQSIASWIGMAGTERVANRSRTSFSWSPIASRGGMPCLCKHVGDIEADAQDQPVQCFIPGAAGMPGSRARSVRRQATGHGHVPTRRARQLAGLQAPRYALREEAEDRV